MRTRRNHSVHRAAFTLVEILVAVAVLLVILLAVARIFSSASAVASQGQANADTLQEVAAFERQLRADIEAMAADGFLAIVSHRVRNDYHDASGIDSTLWLDPNRPGDAWLRSDQLVFFANRKQTTHNYYLQSTVNRQASSNIARLYYGHAFQLINAAPGTDLAVTAPQTFFPPWYVDSGANTQMVNTLTGAGVSAINGTQPGALEWILARQSVLMADDGGSNQVYLSQGLSSQSLFDRLVRNSRTDIVAEQMNEVRNTVTQFNDPSWTWPAQRATILGYVFFPRAERLSATSDRREHALTTTSIGTACSEFAIEWAYGGQEFINYNDGSTAGQFTLFPLDGNGQPQVNDQLPWFGMPDVMNDVRGTQTFNNWIGNSAPATDIESYQVIDPKRHIYTAVFGFDRLRTPWPASLRITMRLHDANQRLVDGREVQFVVNLPERVR